MKPLLNAKVILRNKYYKVLLGALPDSYFKLCAGFILSHERFGNNDVDVNPVISQDFDESRIVGFEFHGKKFQLKGAGRVTKNSIEEIDAFGPYETGPPGGFFWNLQIKNLIDICR